MANKTKNTKSHSKATAWLSALIIFLMIACVGVGLIGYYSAGFSDWSDFEAAFGGDKEPAEETPGTGGNVTDGDGNEMVPGEIYPMPANMIFATTAAENTPITIKATVTPEETTNKELTWSVEWVNASSEWASGKNVADYITLSAGSGDTATVTCKQAFGEQAKIVVATVRNPDAKTECTLDYAMRIVDINFSVINGEDAIDFVDGNNVIPIDVFGIATEEIQGVQMDKQGVSGSVYTIADSFTYTVEVQGDLNAILGYIKIGDNWIKVPEVVYGEAYNSSEWIPEEISPIEINEYFEGFSIEHVPQLFGANNWDAMIEQSSLGSSGMIFSGYNQFMSEVLKGEDEMDSALLGRILEDYDSLEEFLEAKSLTITVTAEGEYSSYTKEFKAILDPAYFEVLPENVTLDKPSLVF